MTALGGIDMSLKILKYDPLLLPFEADLELRMQKYADKKKQLSVTPESFVILLTDMSILDFIKPKTAGIIVSGHLPLRTFILREI